MFVEKKFIARRTFLRGAGITLGLPLLDSMIPAQTPLSQTAAFPVRRFMGIWPPHGAREVTDTPSPLPSTVRVLTRRIWSGLRPGWCTGPKPSAPKPRGFSSGS